MERADDKLSMIENGLQTIKFIQENREEIQRSYGRSAITKPAIKERTAAWEAYIKRDDDKDESSSWGGVPSEDTPQRSRSESHSCDGSDVKQISLSSVRFTDTDEDTDNSCGNDKDNAVVCGRNGKDSGGESSRDAGEGCSGACRGAESSRSISPSQIDHADYDRIMKMDELSELKIKSGEIPVKMEIRPATQEDISEILNEDVSKTHKRLRGIADLNNEDANDGFYTVPVKKGHRREYCIDVFEGKTYVREWCNPGCSRVTVEPRVQQCICGECPRKCKLCRDD